MWLAHLEPIPSTILSQYGPVLDGVRWVPVSGGFSGANVWRGEESRGTPIFALKAWPPEITSARLARIHAWMTDANQLPFMPALQQTITRTTLVDDGSRRWDVARWQPGTPCESPDRSRVEAACAAVARLHQMWRADARIGPCPAVVRRLRVLDEWRSNPETCKPRSNLPLSLLELLRSACTVVDASTSGALQALRPWEKVPLPLQACVRDLRGEHVLFTGSAVTGIVDFGAMDLDHPAGDLARFLGDFAGEDEALFAAGVSAYQAAGGKLNVPDEFVRLLDRSGVLCSIIGWFARLAAPCPSFPVEVVAARLERLVARLKLFRPT